MCSTTSEKHPREEEVVVPGKRAKQGASNNPPTAEHNIASALQEMIENSIESLQSSIKGVYNCRVLGFPK